MYLSYWQWICLALAAFCSGLSKTGIAGLGILPVVLLANVLPPRESTGALLPLLLCGDIHLCRWQNMRCSPHRPCEASCIL
jgi:hypothetical protein